MSRVYEITRTEVFRVHAASAQEAYDEFMNCADNSEFYDHTPHVTVTNTETGEDEDFEEG